MAIDVCVKHTDAGIEPRGEQGYGHLGFEKHVQVAEKGIPRRRRPVRLAGQPRGSPTKRQPEIDPARTSSAVRPGPEAMMTSPIELSKSHTVSRSQGV